MTKGMKYLDIFLREAEEHITSLQNGLLVLEKEPGNAPLIHELLRNAHTLKGSARMLGFEGISSIAHKMEDFLLDVEEERRQVDGAAIDMLLRGTDAISRLTASMASGEESPIDVEKFLEAFERGEAPADDTVQQAPRQEEALGETVRARVKTLDSLVNLIGELIISKKRFEEKTCRLKQLVHGTPDTMALRGFQRELEEDVLYLNYLIQELHGDAMALRMLPLRTITEGFQRMVRDLAREQGKEATLEVVGDSIELDRVLLENLKPMFLHMLSNAVDHGLEKPEERKAAGKNPCGTIRITARHEGSSVRIDVTDDGKGMNPDKIRATALRRGLLGKEEAELLRDDEVLYLTLRQGFSTSEIVTDVSGRGVGMDVVQKNVEKVKGNLLLKSAVGEYTEISLFLPLTLSVIEALMVACGDETFAIPLSYVQESVKIRCDDITTIAGKEVILLRGTTVPLVSVSALLGVGEQRAAVESGKITAVILKLRDQLLACTVDRNLGSSEIVVKGLGGQLKSVRFIFGATILGDGSPALILNVPDVFSGSEGKETTRFRKEFEESLAARQRGKILVVDDSITTRTMERSILVAHGYLVEIAVSAEDALEKVAREQFDLVISDIEMPGLNGFQLTKKLRAQEAYRDVPVIIVSSLSRDEHKRQALEAGAQAYIVKGSFNQGTLLDTVDTLIG